MKNTKSRCIYLVLVFLFYKKATIGGDCKLKGNKLTEQQKQFCLEYIRDLNATQAAIKANYSPKSARSKGSMLLAKDNIKNYIQEKLKEIESEKIATATEALEYVTSVMRGESQSEVIVVVGDGNGLSHIESVKKTPDEKERLKAAEMICKKFALFTDKHEVKVEPPTVIGGEDDLEE